jgi:nickel/cobalt transporter (NiCoT) family protein
MTALDEFAVMYRQREHLPLKTRLMFTFGAVVLLHCAAVVLLVIGTAGAGQPLALGLVLTAYLAGIKHSYDWDHIAAIDNSPASSWRSARTRSAWGSRSAWATAR